ncbi:MAG: CHAT domain-containing protein, partial [Caldilineaceae bacterium]|nr:CHAT domain-containing protein [Caldilineaceae bacterium]
GEDEPVHIVAHGEGGLLARSYIALFPDQWQRHQGRLIMLGTPNHGMINALMAITGHLGLVRWLDQLAPTDRPADARVIAASFPSIFQMFPSPLHDPTMLPLYDQQSYGKELAIDPEKLALGQGHHALLAKVVDPERMVLVAGYNQPTLTKVDIQQLEHGASDADPFTIYGATRDGDGTVPCELTTLHTADDRPVPTCYLEATHNELHSSPLILSALTEMLTVALDDPSWSHFALRKGFVLERPTAGDQTLVNDFIKNAWQQTTAAIDKLVDRVDLRGDKPIERNYVTAEERTIQTQLMRHLISIPTPYEHGYRVEIPFKPPEITIKLVYGDIATIGERPDDGFSTVDAIAVGHYRDGRPYGAIAALDQAISAALLAEEASEGETPIPTENDLLLTQFAERGIIRGELAQPFLLNDPRPNGSRLDRVIAVAGMGIPGRFGVPELTVLVRELCWTLGRMGKEHLATLLIGTGLNNMPVADAVAAWVRGIKNALTGIDFANDGTSRARYYALETITFVEGDPRKVLQIDDALQRERDNLKERNRMLITYDGLSPAQRKVLEQAARTATSAIDSETQAEPSEQVPTRITVELDGATYRFGAITQNAAIPEREIALDPKLVMDANDELAAESDASRQLRLGQFLHLLLIPQDLRDELTGSAPLIMLLDATTARIHWELLAQLEPLSAAYMEPTDEARQSCFLGAGRGFTRQLRTTFAPPPEPPPPPKRILRVLVVADPAVDAHLPGAEEEGIAVADLFERFNLVTDTPNRVEVMRLFGPREATRTSVLRHLMMRSYDVLHFAGHCVYDKENPTASGWIFSNGERLTANEFRRIDRVPKFIFSNACESGITPDRSGERAVALAPTLAESFFERGVSNFVCTAWPVDDRAARDFALTLYAHLLGLHANGAAEGAQKHLSDINSYQAAASQPIYRSMQAARLAILEPPNDIRTWGSYQHYGNPYFRFFAPVVSKTVPTQSEEEPAQHSLDSAEKATNPIQEDKRKEHHPLPMQNGIVAQVSLEADLGAGKSM